MGGVPTLDDSPRRRHAAAAEGPGVPFIVFRTGDGRQGLHLLHRGVKRVTIGRGPGNDIALGTDPDVSRLHAELECLGGEWTIVDDGLSRGGTWLNGERVTGRQRLRDGDVVQVGRTLLGLRVPARPASRRKAAAAPAGSAVPKLTPTQQRVLEALCRPYQESQFATPATSQAIAEELFLSTDAVNAHLRALLAAFGMTGLPQNQRRSALATRAIQLALVG